MDNIVLLGVALLGLCMGSFAGATVWRLRAKQLAEDEESRLEAGEGEYKKLKPLQKVSFSQDRSRCLDCGHVLQWYDLVPLVSWLSTGGKCRYCHKAIGIMEPLIEIGTAAFFVVSYVMWANTLISGHQIAYFGLWLVAGVMLAILFAYDLRWYILPDRVMWPLIGIAAGVAVLTIYQSNSPVEALISVAIGVSILGGLYLLLWIVSRGAWIGFGDVKLGLALALLLVQWPLALLTLFLANIIGCLVIIPGMMTGKVTPKSRIPFGPFLIVGAIVSMFAGQAIIDWYIGPHYWF